MPRASRDVNPVFRSAFQSPDDEFNPNLGVRPVVFDILAPDQETSILPDNLKMVLHVNPTSLNFSYEKIIERIQTKGGYVEQHWGDGARTISFNMVTGGFMRLRTGLSNVTGGGWDTGGTRRETIAYDKYLDMLALFHNNGSIYDTTGSIVFQGILKVTFDGGVYLGWFQSFQVSESAEKPYQFELTAEFMISHEILRLRSVMPPNPNFYQPAYGPPSAGGTVSDLASPVGSAVSTALPSGGTTQSVPGLPVAPANASSSAVPKDTPPNTPADPTLPDTERGPVVKWSGTAGQIDPGLKPYSPKDYQGTSPGWRTDAPALESEGVGILDEIERTGGDLDLAGEGIGLLDEFPGGV